MGGARLSELMTSPFLNPLDRGASGMASFRRQLRTCMEFSFPQEAWSHEADQPLCAAIIQAERFPIMFLIRCAWNAVKRSITLDLVVD